MMHLPTRHNQTIDGRVEADWKVLIKKSDCPIKGVRLEVASHHETFLERSWSTLKTNICMVQWPIATTDEINHYFGCFEFSRGGPAEHIIKQHCDGVDCPNQGILSWTGDPFMLSPVTSKAQTKALLEPWLKVKLRHQLWLAKWAEKQSLLRKPWWVLNYPPANMFPNTLRRRTKLYHDKLINYPIWLRLPNSFLFFPGRVDDSWHSCCTIPSPKPCDSSAEVLCWIQTVQKIWVSYMGLTENMLSQIWCFMIIFHIFRLLFGG